MKTSGQFKAFQWSLLFFTAFWLVQACHNPFGAQPIKESPTAGKAKICIDESFSLLFDSQIYTFESLYPDASITARYKPEADVLDDFLKDSVHTAVLTRELTQEQTDALLKNNFLVVSTKIAHDALALIVNRNNPDTIILLDQIEGLFSGKTSTWNQISSKSAAAPVNVVFDNNKSGNVRYFREKFDLKGNFPANFFAVNSNEEVIKYVEKNRNALGIISVNWISDRNDSTSNRFLQSVRVVEVGTTAENACKPYQGYIAEGSYPLCRDVFMLNRESFAGLGTGFVTFVAGDQGQRIILKSGLVPATMPLRLIKVKKD